MYHSQFGGATKCSFGIYPPPRPSPAGGEGDAGAPPREGEGDAEVVVSPRRRNAIRPATPARMAVVAPVTEARKVLRVGHTAPLPLGHAECLRLSGTGDNGG